MHNEDIMNRTRNISRSMAFNIIGAIVVLLLLYGLISGMVGVMSYSNSFKREYSTTTYHMADTAATLVNGDHLEIYLKGEEKKEYDRTKRILDRYCEKMSVSLVYVIMVDQSDYGRFVSVFNSLDNSVGDTAYTEWEIGHKRDATNDEYRQKYKAIYEQGATYETVYRVNPTDGSKPHITTMVPVKNSRGEVTGILCVQRPIKELIEARRPFLWDIAISGTLLAVVASSLAAMYIRRHFVTPIEKISDEAARFAKENTLGKPLGKLSSLDEISNLALSIDTMEKDMVEYIENLTAVTAERERISAEMSLASTIQENSIPNTYPAFPERTEFDIYGVMDPAKQVGGDFYNFFLIDDDHLALVVGDVSGKGVPAALFMMVANLMIADRTMMGGTPAEILTYVNQILSTHNKAQMFVTAWLGILEISTGKLTAANAGHEYPALRRGDGLFEMFKDKHGFVVGGMEGIQYKDYELELLPGSKIFIYTDGVPEAENAEEAMFGTERMLAALNQNPDGLPEQILVSVRHAVDGFVQDAEQFDDPTMLCLEYKGKNPERI